MKILKVIFYLLIASVLCFIFGGCSLVPSEKQRSESVRSTEAIASSRDLTIRRALETFPERGLSVESNRPVVAIPLRERIEIESHDASNAGSKDAAFGTSVVSIPLGVKLALIGFGIILITAGTLFAWRYLKATWLGHGIQLADGLLAAQIRKVRERMVNAPPDIAAKHAHDIAELEAERGKLAQRLK